MSVVSASPISVREDEPFAHPALFYRGLPEFLAGTVPFIEEGLANGEPVAVAVPGDRLAPLRAELAGAQARVQLLDMSQVGRNPGRILPAVLLAFAEAHPEADRVRIIGEPIWLGRSEAEYPACVQHEALINMAFAGRAVEILCPYDVDALPPSVLADAELTHPVVVQDGVSRVSASFAPDLALADHNRPFPEPTRPPIALPIDAARLTEARQLAEAEAYRAGLDPGRAADFALAVNELVTNSIEHGGNRGSVRIWVEDGHLLAEVRDVGRWRDPLAGRRPVDPEQRRGRGLLLINDLADLVRVHQADDGSTTRIYLRTRG